MGVCNMKCAYLLFTFLYLSLLFLFTETFLITILFCLVAPGSVSKIEI